MLVCHVKSLHTYILYTPVPHRIHVCRNHLGRVAQGLRLAYSRSSTFEGCGASYNCQKNCSSTAYTILWEILQTLLSMSVATTGAF